MARGQRRAILGVVRPNGNGNGDEGTSVQVIDSRRNKESRDTLADVIASLKPGAHVRLFVSSHDRNGRLIDFDALLHRTEDELLSIARATTTTATIGRFVGETFPAFRESSAAIEVYLPRRLSPAQIRTIAKVIVRLARDGNQEAVAVVVNHRLFLLCTDDLPGEFA